MKPDQDKIEDFQAALTKDVLAVVERYLDKGACLSGIAHVLQQHVCAFVFEAEGVTKGKRLIKELVTLLAERFEIEE